MKRLLLASVLLVAALCTSCSSVTTAATAQLSGTYDLTVVNGLAFVTSTYRNELRVLDVSKAPTDWVRAPNPLEPLSIPVVDQPVELARDVRYDANGAELDGPYVYARGLASPEISIVGADRSQLKVLNHVVNSSTVTVTALAARGPADGQGPSTLYYGTWDGAQGTLWSVSIPSADALPGADLTPTSVVTTPGESITSIAVMPDGHSLALATRSTAGSSGRAVILDLNTLATLPLKFPAPVRRLFTHPTYTPQPHEDPTQDVLLPAGLRVFGVLDEASCGGQKRCRGILAVDSATGEISNDVSGFRMVPLVFGRGLINGVTVQPYGSVAEPSNTPKFGMLGIATTTGDTNVNGGEVYFFNAAQLQQEDTNGAPAAVTSSAYVDDANNALDYVEGPVRDSIVVGDGAVHDQSLVLTYQGIIPGLNQLASTDADGQTFRAPGVDVPARVAVGDTIQIIAPDPACTAELTVSQVQADAVVTSDPIPSACANRTAFTIRAAGAEPYVVEGTVDGYLGRVGPNETFTYPAPASVAANLPECASGTDYCPVACPVGQQASCAPPVPLPGKSDADYSSAYFYHPPTFVPWFPAIHFTFGAGDSNVKRGNQYVFAVAGNYTPLFMALDASVYPGWYLPAAVSYVYAPQNEGTSNPSNLVLVSYPSAQGVIAFDPRSIVPNVANASTVVGYR